MSLLHLAHSADWDAAIVSGEYRVSTRGALLDDVGFIHASTSSQVEEVAVSVYADDPATLVVLVVDDDALREAGIVVRYQDGGNGTLYPHIFGALRPEVVTEVRAVAFVDGRLRWVRPGAVVPAAASLTGTIAETDVAGAVSAERALLDPTVRADLVAIDRLLAPGFSEIGRSGRLWDRQELLQAIGDAEPSEALILSELEARALGSGLVLLSYCARQGGRATRRSSLWRATPEGWRIEFHQGTPR